MKKKSMLEIARLRPLGRPHRTVSVEEVELALAWADGTVTMTQAMAGYGGVSASVVYVRLALALRQAVADGLLVRPSVVIRTQV
jgi:hypothetical protein